MDTKTIKLIVAAVVTALLVLVIIPMGLMPLYNIYSSKMAGEAEFAHAEYSKRVAVETARAKKDAAALEAEAEIARAHGVAEANKIIGESLKDHKEYLTYLWITSIDHAGDKTVVYVPTEANLPILEAGRYLEPPPTPKAE